jgi:glycosyltransferase involved in cell wall biosynthesis
MESKIFTVIVVNDGSTDATNSMLAQDFPEVVVLDGGGRGMQRARNKGVEHATTPWVTLLDDDDVLQPDFTKYFQQAIENFPEMQVFVPNLYKFTADKIILQSKQAQASAWLWQQGRQISQALELFYYDIFPIKALLEYQFIFSSGLTMMKKSYLMVGGYDAKMHGVKGEDFEFIWRLLRAVPVTICTKPLVGIRKHSNNDSKDENLLMLGELQVHEVIRAKTTDIEPELAAILDAKIQKIRSYAIDSAFVLSDTAAVRAIAQKIGWHALSWGQRCKYLIALLPTPLAKATIRAIQSMRPGSP